MGYPVVLKVVSQDILHKSDVGGVMVGIKDRMQLVSGYETMLANVRSARPDALIKGVMVSKQAPIGVEAIIGGIDDPVFGPTLMFGLGGIFAEILEDVAFRIAPVSRKHAEDMIREIKGFSILAGVRNRPGCDLDAVTELIISVSRFLEDSPDVLELDLNPVYLYEDGLMAVDTRIIKKKEL